MSHVAEVSPRCLWVSLLGAGGCSGFHTLSVSVSLSEAVDEAVRIITGGLPEIAVEGNGPVENNTILNKTVKRSHEDSDDDEEKGSVVPPVHDIYRARQQKRIR